jgi:hypothetical protein
MSATICGLEGEVTDWTILPVLAVIFLATLIRSAFGFGEALVAVPLLMPVEEAAPLATLVSITVATVDRDQVCGGEGVVVPLGISDRISPLHDISLFSVIRLPL